jgi:5-methylcytosine-specific restriction protein A
MGQWSHLYARTAWRVARARYLKANPLCVMCTRVGKTTAATVVDHIRAHKGDMTLFWARSNWQALCKPHHDSTKQHHERSVGGCDEQGNPLNPHRSW